MANKFTQRNLKRFHFEPWSKFIQNDGLVILTIVDMVPEGNDIIVVAESDDSFAVAFGGDENMSQNLLNPLSELSSEIIEN